MEQNKDLTIDGVQQKLIDKMVFLDNLSNDLNTIKDATIASCAQQEYYIKMYMDSISRKTREFEDCCDKSIELIGKELEYSIKKLQSISKILGYRPKKKKDR